MGSVCSCPDGKHPCASTSPCGDGGTGRSMKARPASFCGLGGVGISYRCLRPQQSIQPSFVNPMTPVTSSLRITQRFVCSSSSDPSLASTKIVAAPEAPNLFTKKTLAGLGSHKCLMTFEVILSVLLQVSLWIGVLQVDLFPTDCFTD